MIRSREAGAYPWGKHNSNTFGYVIRRHGAGANLWSRPWDNIQLVERGVNKPKLPLVPTMNATSYQCQTWYRTIQMGLLFDKHGLL